MLIHVLLATWLPLDEQCRYTTPGESMSDATAHVSRQRGELQRPSTGGVFRNNHSRAIANRHDRQVGHRNLMMLHCNTLPTAC